jgi:hypothetical protein
VIAGLKLGIFRHNETGAPDRSSDALIRASLGMAIGMSLMGMVPGPLRRNEDTCACPLSGLDRKRLVYGQNDAANPQET